VGFELREMPKQELTRQALYHLSHTSSPHFVFEVEFHLLPLPGLALISLSSCPCLLNSRDYRCVPLYPVSLALNNEIFSEFQHQPELRFKLAVNSPIHLLIEMKAIPERLATKPRTVLQDQSFIRVDHRWNHSPAS
jgi:hypothetical protein